MQEPGGIGRIGDVAACVVAALLLAALNASSVHAQDGYQIAGEVDGLYPGAVATLDSRVTNPHPFPIRVVSTTVTVFDASSECPASMLEIGDSQATVEVPPLGMGTVPLDVRMSLSASDACQGATWPLMFTGTAVGTATSPLPTTSVLDRPSLAALVAVGAALLGAALIVVGRDRRRWTAP